MDQPKIKFILVGTELESWELRATWDDFKSGLKHGSEFEKIAIYGNKRRQEIGAKAVSWFLSSEVIYFEYPDEALRWLE